jgi:ribonuclease G
MTERVKRVLGLAPRQTGNKLIINAEKLERRVALLENGVLEEYSIERQTDRNIVGSIFKGRVRNIEHGLKAMFVDIGFEKNAFLHFWDALPAALDSGIEEVDRPTGKKAERKRITAKDIPSIYPVVQKCSYRSPKGRSARRGRASRPISAFPGGIWC